MIRLDKFLCDAGLGTRTEVKQLIKKGLVQVNNETIKKSEYKIDEEKDTVLFQGKEIGYEKNVYIMLHKPAGQFRQQKIQKKEPFLIVVRELQKICFP